MTFKEVVTELMQKTEETEVYACRASGYVDGETKQCIGIRRCVSGMPEKDIVVDGTVFMICGDIYSVYTYKRIESIDTLREAVDSDYRVALRGVSGYYPCVTVDLGTYTVLSKQIVDCDVIKLKLERD